MKRLVIILAALTLSGCASSPIKLIAPEYVVVKVPNELYNCSTVTKFPNTDNLTNEQVGQLILKLQKNNMVCKNSLDAVRQYLDDAETKVKKK